MMELGSWKRVRKAFLLCVDSTAMYVLPSFPGSTVRRDKSSIFPLMPKIYDNDFQICRLFFGLRELYDLIGSIPRSAVAS